MKQKFSNKWVGSKQPRKQRKYLANAPLNIRHKMMSCNLTKKLREKYKRNVPIRKEDQVKVMRGEFKSKTGKVNVVDNKNLRVTVDGIFRTKKDGTKIAVYFNPSNLQIQELNLSDKKRMESVQRKKGTVPKVKEKVQAKKETTKEKTMEKK